MAIRQGLWVAAVLMLAAPASAQLVDNDGYDFIHAVDTGDGGKATELLDSHPTLVNTRSGKGDTGLIIAVRRKDRNWTGFLLQKGADVNLTGAGGETALIAAARVGFSDAIPWLLSLGAKVNVPNKMGETPLIVAVQARDSRTVQKLLDAGADPDHTDSAAGYSARDYAKRDNRATDILRMIETKAKPGSAAPTR